MIPLGKEEGFVCFAFRWFVSYAISAETCLVSFSLGDLSDSDFTGAVCVCSGVRGRGGRGGGLNPFDVATILALSSAVVYTRHSVRVKGN